MQTIKLNEILENKKLQKKVLEEIKSGALFIYPTDTLYGFGCNALVPAPVLRIRKIKGTDHPFSVVAPSKQWIQKNLVVIETSYLDWLPGAFTLIFLKRKSGFLREASPGDSLGVRIPDHPFTKIIQASRAPFISTSANISGQEPITSGKEIRGDLEEADYFIDAGAIANKPSTVIDLSGGKERILRK